MEEKLDFDKVWKMWQAVVEETDRRQQETDRRQQETDRRQQETDRKWQKNERRWQETCVQADKDRAAMRAELEKLSKHLGGIGNNNGAYAENYFYNSLDAKKMFGSEHFDHIELNVKSYTRNLQDEYDIVMYNEKSIAIIETKYRARKEHIEQTINKVGTFRQLFPDYKDFSFYLGLAGFSFDDGVEQAALDAGLAVLKQTGKNIVIYDERMKVF